MNAIIWLALMVVFLIVEASTVVMVSLWFAAGSMAALLVSLLGAPIWLQVALFLAVSGVLLASLRPMVRKHFTPRLQRTNVDAVVGSQGYVTADIDNVAATGSVRLGAMEWTARSTTGAPVSKGTLVKVDKIEGVKAFVTAVEVTAEV
jgi:membrane protein implicated in regulation of membrane protease activity